MDRLRQKRLQVPAFYLVLAVLSLGQGGCLLVAAGAAGGAAAGYAYYKGKDCQAYCANFEDAWAAVHAALNELGMSILSEQRRDAAGWIKTQTADGERVRIKLDLVPGKFPAEGPLTEVSVRVGAFGDHPVSQRVLCQVGYHLVPGPAVSPAPPMSPAPIAPATLTPPQTIEPPLTSSPPPPEPTPVTGK